MSTTPKGLFCKIIEDNNVTSNTVMTKIYSNTNILSNIWFQLSSVNLLEFVIKYNEYLTKANIKLPKLYKIEAVQSGVAITQEVILGTNVRDIINNYYEDKNKLLFYFEKLIEIQVQAYESFDNLRIDLNPDNYIIDSSEDIYLVDITPPLYLGNIVSKSENITIQRYIDLCFKVCPQIAELINNFIRPIIKNKTLTHSNFTLENISNLIDEFINIAIKAWSTNDLEVEIRNYFDRLLILENFLLEPDSYSLKRLWLVKKLFKNKIDMENFYIEYYNLSLTKKL